MEEKSNLFLKFLFLNIVLNCVILFLPSKSDRMVNPQNIDVKFEEEKGIEKLEVNHLYPDTKAFFTINNERKKAETNINYIKNNLLGSSYALYKIKIGEYREEEVFKKIEVIDNIKPWIDFKDSDTVEIPLKKEFKEPGYEAFDNYDGDITDKVKIEGKVNVKKEGIYKLKYKVKDSSSNETEKIRTIIVKKDVTEIVEKEKPSYENYQNTVLDMNFIKDGIYIKGYLKNSSGDYEIKVGKKTFKMNEEENHIYSGKIKLSNLKEGSYNVKIKGKKEENLFYKMDPKDRLERAHLGKKLITFSYEKDKIKIKVEKFKYKYDILIDPGHGGEDTGAISDTYIEKNINLEQSLYEKKRFEEHGLKVKLIRNDDTYGEMRGDPSWALIMRRAFAVGYNAAVSKYSYSNHQNSNPNPTFMGWEVLVPCSLSYKDLALEHKITEEWNKIYPLKENHIRMYARNYETDAIYNKINGQIYHFKDYYAVNRVPYKNFFAKTTIYEGAFLSNEEDFHWYYTLKNYKKMSEVKIKAYVEALSLTYKKPKEDV